MERAKMSNDATTRDGLFCTLLNNILLERSLKWKRAKMRLKAKNNRILIHLTYFIITIYII